MTTLRNSPVAPRPGDRIEHTPGPWAPGDSGDLRYSQVLSGAKLVATVWTTGNSEPRREANARLIAAAPEMLVALRSAEAALCAIVAATSFGSVAEREASIELARVRAAIAKAEVR